METVSDETLDKYLEPLNDLSANERNVSLELLIKILGKILSNPYNESYRNINYYKVHRKFTKFNSAETCIGLLKLCGFYNDKSGMRLIMRRNTAIDNHLKLLDINCKLQVFMYQDIESVNICIVDQLARDIVFGFIRSSQPLLPCNSSYFLIPPGISVICYRFYHAINADQNREYFECYDTNTTQLDHEKTMFTKLGLRNNTIYGNVAISGQYPIIYRWVFQVLEWEWDHSKGLCIGIDSSDKSHINRNSFLAICHNPKFKDDRAYGYNCIGNKFSADNCNMFQGLERFGRGDIICMELNVVQRTLVFLKNDEYIGIVFDNIDFENKKYFLAVAMDEDQTRVKLKSFEQIKYAACIK